jgi:ribosomal protein L34
VQDREKEKKEKGKGNGRRIKTEQGRNIQRDREK